MMSACIRDGKVIGIDGLTVVDSINLCCIKILGCGYKLMSDNKIYKISDNTVVDILPSNLDNMEIIWNATNVLLLKCSDNYYCYTTIDNKLHLIGNSIPIIFSTAALYIDNSCSDNKLFMYVYSIEKKYECDTNVNCIIHMRTQSDKNRIKLIYQKNVEYI
jgi:hypothetical protein